MPLLAPPAPRIRTLLPVNLTLLLMTKSFTSPIPSVLSPRMDPTSCNARVLTALLICARPVLTSAYAQASSFSGIVQFKPLPPLAKNSATAPWKLLGGYFLCAIFQFLSGLFGKNLVNEWRLAMFDWVAKDGIAIS